jgi:membrane protease YdiL (CAAX protease family)
MGTDQPGKAIDSSSLMKAAFLLYIPASVLSIGGAILYPRRLGFQLLPSSAVDAIESVLAGLIAGAVIIVVARVIVLYTNAGRRLAISQGEALSGVSFFSGQVLAVLAGVAEELVFRGALWSLFSSFSGPWVALVVTSLLFGAVHGSFRRGYLLWSSMAAVSGIVAGLLLICSGNLLAPIMMHVLVDAVDIPLMKRMVSVSSGTEARRRP